MERKFIVVIILMLSILSSIILTYLIDKSLYISPEKYVESNFETKEVKLGDGSSDIIHIKYNWQIAIPKLDVVAPIGEGSDIATLRNRVGHITGTNLLFRKYLFSSVTIIQETMHPATTTLIELMN